MTYILDKIHSKFDDVFIGFSKNIKNDAFLNDETTFILDKLHIRLPFENSK